MRCVIRISYYWHRCNLKKKYNSKQLHSIYSTSDAYAQLELNNFKRTISIYKIKKGFVSAEFIHWSSRMLTMYLLRVLTYHHISDFRLYDVQQHIKTGYLRKN